MLCPEFKLLPKDGGDEASDLVFQAGSVSHENGKDSVTAPSRNSHDFFLGCDAWRKRIHPLAVGRGCRKTLSY